MTICDTVIAVTNAISVRLDEERKGHLLNLRHLVFRAPKQIRSALIRAPSKRVGVMHFAQRCFS